ncbi:hypothetical protein, partial [Pseudomonas sp. PA-3-6H]|uniref:hypothetical protein n=1 Tax=Pseudomonas sp. PA-3-6H TaxID=2665475 RepID=UPI003FA7533A
ADKRDSQVSLGGWEMCKRASADTTGGKIAAAIKAQGSGTAENIDVPDQQPAPSFGDNSLAGGPADADPESEVAAFANREQGRDGTTA